MGLKTTSFLMDDDLSQYNKTWSLTKKVFRNKQMNVQLSKDHGPQGNLFSHE